MVFYPGERSSYLNFDVNSLRSQTIGDVYGLIGVGNNNDGILLDPSTIDNEEVIALLNQYIEDQRTPGTFFVSKDGVAGNVGTSLRDSVPTIREAVQLANAYVTSNSGSSAFIIVHPGTYQEILPIRVKRNISIYGRSLRGIEVRPAPGNEFNTFFKVDSGFKAWGLTLAGHQADTTRQAWCFEFDELANNLAIGASSLGAFINKSPYIQNCTSYTAEDDRGEAGSVSTGNTGGGLKVDGNACASNSPIRSMVVDSFTQINLGGPGCLVTNDGYAQLVSFFGTFCTYHCRAEKGGQVNFTGGTSDFGEYGLVADGYSPLPIFSATSRRNHYGAIRTERACTVNSSTNTLTSNSHGFINGDQLKISGTEIPDPLIRGVVYYVVEATTNTFKLSSSLNGSSIDITGTVTSPVVATKEGEYIIDCINFTDNRLGLESQPYNGTLAFPVLVFPRGTSLASSAANKGTVSSVNGSVATAILNTSTEAVGTHEYVVGTGTVTVTRSGVDTTYPVTNIEYSHTNGVTNFTATGYSPLVNDTFFFSNAEFICPKSAYTVTGAQAINNLGVVVSFNDPAAVGYRVNLSNQTNGGLLYPVTTNQKIDFRRRSQITAPAHVFEFVGSGTNYTALPDNGGRPDQTKAYQEINQGRVFISWTNEKGDFGVGNRFLVDGTTGEVTINTSSFNLSGLNQIGPFSRNGGISTVGTVLKEVSDDNNLISSLGVPDSNTVPTQSAVYNYVTKDKRSVYIGINFIAQSGVNYIVDTSNGPVTATLPPNPTNGFSVSFTDYQGNFSTNSLTITRSGAQTLIDGQTTSLILDSNFQSCTLTWTEDDNTWSLSSAEYLKVSSAVSGVVGTGSVAGITLSGSITTAGALTLSGALGSINEHSDVDTTTAPPLRGNVLLYDGNSWVPSVNGLSSPEIITTPTGTVKRFTQDTAPTVGVAEGDIWHKPTDGDHPGTTGLWVRRGLYWVSTNIIDLSIPSVTGNPANQIISGENAGTTRALLVTGLASQFAVLNANPTSTNYWTAAVNISGQSVATLSTQNATTYPHQYATPNTVIPARANIPTGGTLTASPLGQTSRQWAGMTSVGTDIYACVYSGDIYKQTGGVGNFLPLGQTTRSWWGMTSVGTDIYTSVYGGDIYKQTGGVGNFIALGQAARQWHGMTSVGTDIYASVLGGDIYKQTGGVGNFIALGQTSRQWYGMTSVGTDVYASVYGGDIYKQTGGTGNFIALGQTSRQWLGMTSVGTDVYTSVYGGDIYKQTGGTGNFIALGQTSRQWYGMTSVDTNVYACANGGDIYILTNGGITSIGHSLQVSLTRTGSISLPYLAVTANCQEIHP